jgi:uncharacterized repeat protein (TIGR01451 family)
MRKTFSNQTRRLSGLVKQNKGSPIRTPDEQIPEPKGGQKMNSSKSTIFNSILRNRLAASIIALSTAFGSVIPAYAAIENTVTITGTSPSGPITPVVVGESVDVEDPNTDLQIVKTADFASGGDLDSDTLGDENDIIEYTYTVTNNSNVTMSNVNITDTHDGSVALGTINFDSFTTIGDSPTGQTGSSITMAPGSVAVFKVQYTITQDDIFGAGGTGVGASVDGDIDNSAIATGTYNIAGGGTANDIAGPSLAEFPLDVEPSLDVTKVASNDTNVAAGTTITYTYTITNNGAVPITNIALSDEHKGVVGALVPVFDSFTTNNGDGGANFSTNSGNTIDILYPGDVAVYTVDYLVTQDDVDNLQ